MTATKTTEHRTLVKDISELLRKPVPLPAIFQKAIPLPSMWSRAPRRRPVPQKRVAKGTKRAPQKPVTLKFAIEGTIERGKETLYAIAGEDFVVGHETWVFGDIERGSLAKVRGIITPAGQKLATHVVIGDQ